LRIEGEMVEVQVERRTELLDNVKCTGQCEVEIICGDVIEEMKKSVAKGEELDFEVEANALKIKPKRAILRKQVTSQ
jgi:hypothetical protein